MVTPFTAEGKVDLPTAAELAAHLVSKGNDGLVVGGTAGEASTMDEREKEELIRVVKETVGDTASVIAGTGTNDTARSITMSQRAAKAGADGQLVVTPYFNKPTQSGLFEHFSSIAAATELPMMLYDIPGRTGTAISTDTMRQLAENPRIVALKDAKADFTATTIIMAQTNLAVYAGDDALALPWLTAGAAGLVSVTAHAAPELFRELINAVDHGNLPQARQTHFALAPLVRAVMGHIPGAASAKHILHHQKILPRATVRAPLTPPNSREAANIAAELEETPWDLS
ncbi:4-hydroxy-tetrahydrodipicolinate synthase [Arthrobacter sp. Soil761]|nr:4-hydroxy-tetrahydrodipicolinate synthase [Arthrobacter sp. Soil761]